MKAAILKTFGSPLAVGTLPDPLLGTGEVVVDVVASDVLPYANKAVAHAAANCGPFKLTAIWP